LEQLHCRTLRIDQLGAVRIEAAPNHFKIKTFLDTGPWTQATDPDEEPAE
jgi:hypothetical protein